MIATAIYELLNVTAITSITNGVFNQTAPQQLAYPYIVFSESNYPELYKRGYKIVHHNLLVTVYCSKGKDGNGGFAQAATIAQAVRNILTYYTGTAAGHNIDTIILETERSLYDPISEAARIDINYKVRENTTANSFGPAGD
jgi:hypothetical protein